MRIRYLLFPLLAFLFLQPGWLRAEGTKELMPDSNQNATYILLVKGYDGGQKRDSFAIEGATYRYWLCIHISPDYANEEIHFGIGAQVGTFGNVSWKIYNPNNAVVWTGTTPTAGTGYIAYYSQAYAGPLALDPHGYPSNVYQPTMAGDYYMTFTLGSNQKRVFGKIDITVLNKSNPGAPYRIPGRVFSRCWQLSNTPYNSNHFVSLMYIYTKDDMVMRLNPNGIDARDFSFTCNESGCYPIDAFHNAQQARQSQPGPNPHNNPEYPVFLNNPDSLEYPSGELGELVPGSVTTQAHCNGTVDFTFQTTGGLGNVEIDLTLSALGAPYADRIITQTVAAGTNTITWDGKDGNGLQVPDGSTFPFTLTYYNGLTHLPLWDFENNSNGFKVNLIRPNPGGIPDPGFYWDDVLVGGTTVITPPGCISTPITGCHLWSGDFGDQRTINTWFYIYSNYTTPVTITYIKGPNNLGGIGGPANVCQGSTVTFSVGADPSSDEYHWVWSGGTIVTTLPTVNITYPVAEPPGPETVKVSGWNTDCGDGPISVKNITIIQSPQVDPPAVTSICSGNTLNVNLTSTPAGATFAWTAPSPTCTANILTCPPGSTGSTLTNVLSVTDLNPGLVTYHITPTYMTCAGPTYDYNVSVAPLPDIIINSTTPTVCNGIQTNIQLSSTITGTMFTWTASASSGTVGGYTTPGSGNLIADVLTNSGSTIETVTYTITSNAAGCINPTPSLYTVTVFPTPVASVNSTTPSVCSGGITNLMLNSTVGGTTFTWTAVPSSPNVSGYSNPGAGNVISDVLSNSGTTVESVTYTITPTANGCSNSTPAVYTVTVYPVPNVLINSTTPTVCNSGLTNIQFSSSVAGTTYSWTAVPSSGNISGYTSPGSGNLIADVLTN
ncbi:MAG TPA: PKD-like domain-containing protein, partial [Bacteroidales bacterium]|nr:PKD-like domain-containing protein [Bacteroidales bacterium]